MAGIMTWGCAYRQWPEPHPARARRGQNPAIRAAFMLAAKTLRHLRSMPKLKMIEEIVKRTMRPNMPAASSCPEFAAGSRLLRYWRVFRPAGRFFSLAADAASAFRVRRAA